MLTVYSNVCPVAYLPLNYSLSPDAWISGAFRPLVILPQYGTMRPFRTGLAPVHGITDRYGNHECFHDNLTGTVISLNVPQDAQGWFIVNGRRYNTVIDLSRCNTGSWSHAYNPSSSGEVAYDVDGDYVTIDLKLTALDLPKGTVWMRRWYRHEYQIKYFEAEKRFAYRNRYAWSETMNGADFKDPGHGSWSSWIDEYTSRVLPIYSKQIDCNGLALSLQSYANIMKPTYNDKLIWGRLSQDACDNAKAVSQNMVATILDAKELPSLVKMMKDLLRKKVTPKTIASAFLCYKYAIAPSVSDGKEIASAVSQRKQKFFMDSYFVRSRTNSTIVDTDLNVWQTQFNLKCYYLQENDVFAGIFQGLMSWGFAGLEDVWDLIPFSFVVDWVYAFGDMLAQQDAATFCSVLPVMSVIQTRCDSTSVNLNSLCNMKNSGLCGCVTLKLYNRSLVPRLTPPYVEPSKPTNPFRHIAEGTALLIATGKTRHN